MVKQNVAKQNVKKMTRERLGSLYEGGGLEWAWAEVQVALEDENIAGFWEGHQIRDYEHFLVKFKYIWAIWRAVMVTTGLGLAIWLVAQAQVQAGNWELATCAHGNALPCEVAISQCVSNAAMRRIPLYRAAYQQATGKPLPNLTPPLP